MLNPYYGLFQYSRDDIYTLQINPDSAVNPVGKLSYAGGSSRRCAVTRAPVAGDVIFSDSDSVSHDKYSFTAV